VSTWDELVDEFRALGGTLENVRLGHGALGRGLFPIEPGRPLQQLHQQLLAGESAVEPVPAPQPAATPKPVLAPEPAVIPEPVVAAEPVKKPEATRAPAPSPTPRRKARDSEAKPH